MVFLLNLKKIRFIDENPEILKQSEKTKFKLIQSCQADQTHEQEYYFTKPEELPKIIKEIG